MNTVWKVLTRKKVLDPVSTEESNLGRVLNTFDLTALGVGSTLGVGVYVLAGHVAKDTAGPSVVLSFLIAAVASVFAGLCYAEFGARAPRAGSAYIYSYVCVGEFIAFVIGWNLILEYVIGSASVARGLSNYVDSLLNNTLNNTFIDIFPIHGVSFLSQYFDPLAFSISVLLAIALAFGMKESSIINNIITLINVAVVIFAVIAGSTKASTANWRLSEPPDPDRDGTGGFFPYGIEGMIKGASTCFYGFVGFDCIATTGEEVKNPKRAIPIAIISSLFVIFLAYFSTSTVVTLMLPYYDQNPNAPFPYAFEHFGMDWAKWIVAIGAIFGLLASLFGAMFPLPRILYAMASDSLIFRFLGTVNSRFKTPVIGTIIAGVLTGLMAAIFELRQLVDMMSIGTLMAYTIVAASVLLLRYEVEKEHMCPLADTVLESADSDTYSDNGQIEGEDIGLLNETQYSSRHFLKQIFNFRRQDTPTVVSEKIVKIQVCLYCVMCLLIGLCAKFLKTQIGDGELWAIVLSAVIVAITVLVVLSIAVQPTSHRELSFKVPLVPIIPALSILVNIYLMLMLDPNTWIRFGVWMLIGLPTYYFSVQIKSDARNKSISSRDVLPNGKLNGNITHDSNHTENEISSDVPTPSSLNNRIERTIAELDQVIEDYNVDRKYSIGSLSTASGVMHEENVQADVHCADVPVTPVEVKPDPIQLLQSLPESNNPSSSDILQEPNTFETDKRDSLYATPTNDNTDILVTNCDQRTDLIRNNNLNKIDIVGKDLAPNLEQNALFNLMESIDKPDDGSPIIIINTDRDSKNVEPNPPGPVTESKDNTDISASVILNEEDISPSGVTEIVPETADALPFVPPSPPPPPPPTVIPRVIFRDRALPNVKLRQIQPVTPSPDYTQQNSDDTPQENYFKFGSPEYLEFKEKLRQQLEQGYRLPPHVSIRRPLVPTTPPIASSTNENVINDNIDQNDAKEKLAMFYKLRNNKSTPSLPQMNNEPVINNVRNVSKNEPDDDEDNGTDFKEQHRRNMQNIFGSIQLRKMGDSLEKNLNEESPIIENSSSNLSEEMSSIEKTNPNTINNDRLQHKENMSNIFRSIRLRKEDSFKSNESQ